MAKINRHQGNMTPFASNASTANRYAFGTTTNSDELDLNLNPDYGQGWGAVAGGEDDMPVIQDFNALGFTTNKLIEYLFQSGIAEYDDEQTYYIDSVVTSGGKIYISLTDDNTGNDVTNLTHWNSTFDEDHEHSADDITSGVLATARIPDLNTSKITTGVFDSDRIPDIDTDKIADDAITTDKITDDAITLAKMDAGTAGNLITYNQLGNPIAVATGTVGQVLTSRGAGLAPTMQDASTGADTDLSNLSTTGQDMVCTAWVNFDGTGTVAIRDSYNVSSITDNGVGEYTVNFATPMNSADYVVAGGGTETAGSSDEHSAISVIGNGVNSSNISTGFHTKDFDGSRDWEQVCLTVFGGK